MKTMLLNTLLTLNIMLKIAFIVALGIGFVIGYISLLMYLLTNHHPILLGFSIFSLIFIAIYIEVC